MIAKTSGATSDPASKTEVAVTKDGVQLPDELGVYHLKDGKYVSVKPEVLNERTARAGAAFTYGIKAAKINGWVVNLHSPNHVAPDTEFILKIPEGVDPTEYVCVKFNVKSDRLEVELARGRINVSTSTFRAGVEFTNERLAKGIYRLKFGTLKPGEYGFLPPGAVISKNASSAGKIYTFTVE